MPVSKAFLRKHILRHTSDGSTVDLMETTEPKIEPVKNGWHALSPTLHLAVWGATENDARAAFVEAVERDTEIRSRPALRSDAPER